MVHLILEEDRCLVHNAEHLLFGSQQCTLHVLHCNSCSLFGASQIFAGSIFDGLLLGGVEPALGSMLNDNPLFL